MKTASMSGFGSHRAGGSTDEEPPGGAATASDSRGVVAFARERGGFATFVGEVSLGRGKFCLASFAVDGEIVERF